MGRDTKIICNLQGHNYNTNVSTTPIYTFRTETLQMQGSRIPVVALALILHINENLFFQ